MTPLIFNSLYPWRTVSLESENSLLMLFTEGIWSPLFSVPFSNANSSDDIICLYFGMELCFWIKIKIEF
jgi:hypothetical protein